MSLWALYDWDEDCMRALERAYEIYTDQLTEYVMGDIEYDTLDIESGDAFCGCETCWRRETFAFLMPRFIELYRAKCIWERTQHTNEEDADGVQLVPGSGDMESGGV